MKKVMIVDDNYLSVEGITKNIDWNLLDAKVLHVAYNGDSAIEAMKKSPVDLIISDIEMPNLDGISMSSMALSINPLVKIILISAYDKFEYAKRAIRLGVCDYIEKPLDYEYLTRKIQNAFAAIDREQRNMELLEQSRPVMTEKFFIDLLNYSGSNARGHLKHYADYLNLNLEYNCFDVLKIEIENAATVESELGITQYQIELMNAMDLLQEKCLIFDSVYLVREFSGITCILGQNTKNTNHFIQVIHKTISTFFDIYKDSVLNMN
ncbi:MAG: response regulator, partial [Clostridia bacterium]|nr:response regulator [Clostridia bacterium]